MSEHEDERARPEAGADELEDRTERLADLTEDVREDWERKKADPDVPGAAGDPEAARSDGQPETDYPTKSGTADDLM